VKYWTRLLYGRDGFGRGGTRPYRFYERPRRQREQLVRAIADDDILRPAAMKFRELFAKQLCRGIGIKPQPPIHRLLDRSKNLGRWGERILIGVELDEALDLWLLARNVRMQVANQRADQ
jgi:hypothetical protein